MSQSVEMSLETIRERAAKIKEERGIGGDYSDPEALLGLQMDMEGEFHEIITAAPHMVDEIGELIDTLWRDALIETLMGPKRACTETCQHDDEDECSGFGMVMSEQRRKFEHTSMLLSIAGLQETNATLRRAKLMEGMGEDGLMLPVDGMSEVDGPEGI